jgi:hypothetical protein
VEAKYSLSLRERVGACPAVAFRLCQGFGGQVAQAGEGDVISPGAAGPTDWPLVTGHWPLLIGSTEGTGFPRNSLKNLFLVLLLLRRADIAQSFEILQCLLG